MRFLSSHLAPYLLLLGMASALLTCQSSSTATDRGSSPPNILLVISDDQSYPHASAYGYAGVETPAFDRIAREGVLFHQAYAASPGCSPSRAALLTGRHCWQLEGAGTHASNFLPKYQTYPELLAAAGYEIGHTGKGWGPGNWQLDGRTHNPAGPAWNELTMEVPEGVRATDYAANFAAFLEAKDADQPFCFWFGAGEPHRKFGKGLGLASGKDPNAIEVPGFLPDHPEVRADLLDYAFEIEWYDQHLGRMLTLLEEKGELDQTLIIVTSDNGMAFPRAKANAYEFGIHVPMAIRWGNQIASGRETDDLVGFIDLAPTILEASGIKEPETFPMSGSSLLPLLRGEGRGNDAVFASRERHSSVRYKSLGYPQRAIRRGDFLYLRNFKPERWPAGAPQKYGTGSYPKRAVIDGQETGSMHRAYHDIDACPTLTLLVEGAEDPTLGSFLDLAVQHRPAEELYDVAQDPHCLRNLAGTPAFAELQTELRQRLETYLQETGDPRMLGKGDIWETYPRYSRLRAFPEPDWAKDSPNLVPEVPWLETHWAKQD